MSKRSISEIQVDSVEENDSLAIGSFFKGFRAPVETDFELYRKHASKKDYLLHGENQRLEYEGRTDDLAKNNQSVVAIYNSKKNTVQLYKAPILVSKVVSKADKNLRGPTIKNKDVRGSVLRNALGEAFGTKKAKKAIADLERNRIDAEKLSGVAVDIVDAVRVASKDLPTRQQLEENVSNDRPTPVANVDATDVEQIYPVENIISDYEMQFIRVGHLLKETDVEKKMESFPFASKYITKKLPVFTQPTQLPKLQLLYYLSLLLGVYNNRRVNNKVKLLEILNSPPETLIDGVLDKFTLARPGQFGRSKDRSFFIDPQHEDKLLCYILTIIMHLDNFIVEISPLAQELNTKPSKIVALFRVLGAIVKGATVAQADAFGIAKSAANTYKIATLKVPFKLPEMVRRGRGPRR
ncbi:DNA-directed RNA polymerase I subunit rpa49 [Maudiozyma exigua]|uniref:DNA-directed RNA polymerase I subunit rpa49 n=1 Tax=Maudiozyma exigua TaxID=34358 RepID=A0A9P6WD05_MAUEX|nr:DNA-directed RNA polymerase I subunit rpa49 [Kazachstania exigua]